MHLPLGKKHIFQFRFLLRRSFTEFRLHKRAEPHVTVHGIHDRELDFLFRLEGHIPEKKIGEFFLRVVWNVADREKFFLCSGGEAEASDEFRLMNAVRFGNPDCAAQRKSDLNGHFLVRKVPELEGAMKFHRVQIAAGGVHRIISAHGEHDNFFFHHLDFIRGIHDNCPAVAAENSGVGKCGNGDGKQNKQKQ